MNTKYSKTDIFNMSEEEYDRIFEEQLSLNEEMIYDMGTSNLHLGKDI